MDVFARAQVTLGSSNNTDLKIAVQSKSESVSKMVIESNKNSFPTFRQSTSFVILLPYPIFRTVRIDNMALVLVVEVR